MKPYLNTTLRNVLWFKAAHEREELDMKPPFQRNPVWVTRQKSFLIDTILTGFPIPELYMLEVVTGEGQSKHIVVDGQQRIRAILEFMAGEFAIDPKDSPTWADMSFDDLSEQDKKKIYTYNFVVRMLPELDDIQIRAIFQRLNRNVLALNKQELRQATYWGAFLNLMNEISDRPTWQLLRVFTQTDVRRMRDVEYISELTIAALNGHQNKKDRLDDYYQLYEEEFEDTSTVEELFTLVLMELTKTLPDITKTRWKKKTDFYTLFLVFAAHKDSLPFNKAKRKTAHRILHSFGADLDNYVKATAGKEEEFSENVRTYGAGIRASTDLGSRKRRFEGLEKELNDIWD